MAPPLLLTEARFYALCAAVRAGATPNRASREANVSESTISHWLQQGRAVRARVAMAEHDVTLTDTEAAMLALLEGIESAARDWEQQGLDAIRAAGDGEDYEESVITEVTKTNGDVERTLVVKAGRKKQWQAWAWLLERRMPKEYARVTKNEISGVEGAPVQVETVAQKRERAVALVRDELAVRRARRGIGESAATAPALDVESSEHGEPVEAIPDPSVNGHEPPPMQIESW